MAAIHKCKVALVFSFMVAAWPVKYGLKAT